MKREELLGWLDSLIINSAELGESADAKSWRDTEGILISRNEAEEIRTHLSLPPAEGADEILASLVESLGEPDNSVTDHSYQIRPLTVEGKREWWMFHNGVGSGEPLAQWLSKFASLHAQKIADKMVGEKWINVKDRLPRKDGKSSIYCLVNSEYDGIVMRPYNEYHQCWDTEDADDYYCDAIGGKITHWTPLPNPPIK